ncbi:MAG: heme ABC exporter ATP-binding protein CcmA [Chloroflexi bacterium]|nr:heme ABC exporter ATP-binding protein CcmA [Chloroflexota bacterium]
MADCPYALETHGLGKAFGGRFVLRDLDLRLPWGRRLVVFGANGAGKTTLQRVCATLSRPTRGWLTVAGLDPLKDVAVARRAIGVVAHQTYLYVELTVGENLAYYGRLYGVADLQKRIVALLATLGLLDRRDDPVRLLSRGQQQRLALARALLHEPRLLLLDEPDSGLDQAGFAVLRHLLAAHLAAGGAALVTSNVIERGLQLGDEAACLQGGRLAPLGAASDLDAAAVAQALEEGTGPVAARGGEGGGRWR